MSNNIDGFVHLHSHSENSALDGYGTAQEMMAEVARLGQPAMAFTDHGSLVGIYEGYKQGKAFGVKFIAGIEAYFTPSTISHTDKVATFFGQGGRGDVSGAGAYTHLTLLAENNQGLQNLYKLNLRASTEGFYKKPRMSLEMLADHSEGLIVTTGCPSGEVQTRLRLGQFDEALSFAAQLVDIVGRGNVFVELMDHDMSIDLERVVRPGLMKIAKMLDLPLVATNDLHYAKADDHIAHEKMLAIQTRSTMAELPDHKGGNRFSFEGSSYYIKSAAEMYMLFPEKDFPGAITNTLAIAERCNISIEEDPTLRPKVPIPDGFTEEEWLTEQTFEGFARRLPQYAGNHVYEERLRYELGIINERRFAGYHLVVSEFTRWAKSVGIPVGAGRGSAAGSLVCFCLDITDVEPIKHKLFFERFLNPERDSPPDIDMDFADTRRAEVIAHVAEVYGADQVSQVITYGRIGAKQGLKDSGRILDFPYSVGDQLTKALPPAIFGKEIKLKEAYDPSAARYPEAEDFRAKVIELEAEELVNTAKSLEGRFRSSGMHAAAVIISNQPIVQTVPMVQDQKTNAMIAQWDYPTSEALGLLKVDFLGLRNLGIVDDAVKLIKERKGIDIDLDAIKQGPMDDKKTFDLLRAGNTLGVFQLDGGPMRSLLKLMKPTSFDDISAVLALYRPGPMGVNAHTDYALRKNGEQEATAIHPEFAETLAEILDETHNLIVYQEQVMQIAQTVSGYTLAKADNLRRAMGKKKREVLDAEYIPYRDGAKANGYSDEAIKALWDVLVPFADYSFNKSHTVAYGYMSYITAYLKANYPAEFMAALLTSVSDDTAKTAEYLDDCRSNGLKVLPPDLNNSRRDYYPLSDTKILFGLKAIKGVGSGSADEIVKARLDQGKDFSDFSDFMNSAPRAIINKRIIEGLIYGGAFDSMGATRKALIDSLEPNLKMYQKAARAKPAQSVSLFDGLDFEDDMKVEYNVLPAAEYPEMERLRFERAVLGLYVSAHPLDALNFGQIANQKIIDLTEEKTPAIEGFAARGKEPNYTIAGILTTFARRKTKVGKNFGSGVLEDKSGSIDIVLFSKTFDEYQALLNIDGVYALSGYSQKREGQGLSFIVNSVRPLEFSNSGTMAIRVKVTADQWERGEFDLIQRLTRHVTTDKSSTDVVVSIRALNGDISEETISLGVKASPALLQEIRELFGMTAIGRWRKPSVDTTVEEKTAE